MFYWLCRRLKMLEKLLMHFSSVNSSITLSVCEIQSISPTIYVTDCMAPPSGGIASSFDMPTQECFFFTIPVYHLPCASLRFLRLPKLSRQWFRSLGVQQTWKWHHWLYNVKGFGFYEWPNYRLFPLETAVVHTTMPCPTTLAED